MVALLPVPQAKLIFPQYSSLSKLDAKYPRAVAVPTSTSQKIARQEAGCRQKHNRQRKDRSGKKRNQPNARKPVPQYPRLCDEGCSKQDEHIKIDVEDRLEARHAEDQKSHPHPFQ